MFKVTFVNNNNLTVEVDPKAITHSEMGQPGSILDIALANGIDIEHVCGGGISCSSCHVVLETGFDTCNDVSRDELDQLESSQKMTKNSRLACQCVPNGEKDIIIKLP